MDALPIGLDPLVYSNAQVKDFLTRCGDPKYVLNFPKDPSNPDTHTNWEKLYFNEDSWVHYYKVRTNLKDPGDDGQLYYGRLFPAELSRESLPPPISLPERFIVLDHPKTAPVELSLTGQYPEAVCQVFGSVPGPLRKRTLLEAWRSTLADRVLASGSFPLERPEKMWLCHRLLEAVQALERLRIVHLDLSPETVYIFEDGSVKLAGLGLCKRYELACMGYSPEANRHRFVQSKFTSLLSSTSRRRLSDVFVAPEIVSKPAPSPSPAVGSATAPPCSGIEVHRYVDLTHNPCSHVRCMWLTLPASNRTTDVFVFGMILYYIWTGGRFPFCTSTTASKSEHEAGVRALLAKHKAMLDGESVQLFASTEEGSSVLGVTQGDAASASGGGGIPAPGEGVEPSIPSPPYLGLVTGDYRLRHLLEWCLHPSYAHRPTFSQVPCCSRLCELIHVNRCHVVRCGSTRFSGTLASTIISFYPPAKVWGRTLKMHSWSVAGATGSLLGIAPPNCFLMETVCRHWFVSSATA